MAQYSFLDCNYFKENEKNDKDIYNKSVECELDKINKNVQKNILDPDISIIKIKDIEKGS